MKSSKKENFVYAALMCFFGVFTVYGAYRIPSRASLGLGADYLPKIVGYLLLFLSLCFLIKGLLIRSPKKATDQTEKAEKTEFDIKPVIKFSATILFLIIYVLLFKKVGFIIMTALYIFAQSLLMVPSEKRNILLSAVLGIVTSILLYLIFSKGLNMLLPNGILKGVF